MRIKKVIDSRTAEGRALLARAACDIGDSIFDVYSHFSSSKAKAYEEVVRKYRLEKGTGFHITSANSFQFCVAWNGIAENGQHYTRYITAKYDYWIF